MNICHDKIDKRRTALKPHQFHWSKDSIGTCSCGRWAVAKAPWLAKKYGFSFKELTEDQAREDWAYHIQNLPGRAKVQGMIGKQRLGKMLGNLAA
jgi:hypothetical protein